MKGPFLLDTDILIDYLHGQEHAVSFLNKQKLEGDLAISVISSMELIQGSQNKMDFEKLSHFLEAFWIIPITAEISHLAAQIFVGHYLRTKLDIPDAFIAATAIDGQRILVSRNLRHYRSIKTLQVHKPY